MKGLKTSGARGAKLRLIMRKSKNHLLQIANRSIIHYTTEAIVEAEPRRVGIVIRPETG